MFRIAVDGRELTYGIRTGIGRYLVEVLRAASEAGWECLVYGNRATPLPVAFPGVTLHLLKPGQTQWWDQISLPLRLAQDRVSVFLSPYFKGPLLSPCPTVLTIHDLLFIGYPGRRRPFYDAFMTLLARLYASRATAIIADSEHSTRSIIRRLGVPTAKVSVIPVALGKEFKPTPLRDEVRARYGIDQPYILYVGNFKPHKNLPRLLQAYAKLPDSLRGSHRLVLAGGGHTHQQELERLARTLEVADSVLFPGLIAGSDLPALYSGSALFILPSLEEGFGLPAVEAMACGAPVVASNRAAIPEVVESAAILFDPEDSAAIADAMVQVLSMTELQETLRQRGFARAREFSPDRTSGRVLALLRDVSEAARKA